MGDENRDVNVMTDEEAVGISALLSLLREPMRLRLILLLCQRERPVHELVELLKAPQPTVSNHLRLLRRAQILVARRSGKSVFYGLGPRMELAEDGCDLQLCNAGIVIQITRQRDTAPGSDAGTASGI